MGRPGGQRTGSDRIGSAALLEDIPCHLNYAQGHLEPLGNLFYDSRNGELRLREPLPRSHPNGERCKPE
jgi:hypothetical protein